MSAELDFTIGRAAIAYSGLVPWHGHGIQMKPGMTFDEWRVAAGLDYEVESRQLFYSRLNTEQKRVAVKVPNKFGLVRTDTEDFLSIVSKDYHIVQPHTVFDFFQDLISKEGLDIEVAGALDGGRKIWALAKLDDEFTLYGRDTQIPYVLVATSYDGSLATQAMLTTTRVVCNNTMRFSGAFDSAETSDSVKIRHDREFNIAEAHGKLGLDEDAWNAYKANIEQMAAFQLSREDALEYFYLVSGQGDEIVRNADNGNIISFPEPSRVTKQFINAYLNGPGANLRSAEGTLFGAVNAVSFYQDHLAPAHDNGVRFNSSTFGGGNVRKQHAFRLAVEKFEGAVAA